MTEEMYISKKLQSAIKKIGRKIRKCCFFLNICLHEELREEADGLTGQQIIDLIRDFLKDDPDDFQKIVFLQLLAYYPQSMVNRHLTPTAASLISCSYFYAKYENLHVSMDDLKTVFHRSKSTVHEAIKKLSDLEVEIKEEVEKQKIRDQARNIALEQLIEEEKEKLKTARANNRTNMLEQSSGGT